MSFLKYRVLKGYEVLPHFLTHPSRIPALFKGATPARLITLDVPWIRQMGIRSVLDVGANVGQFAAIIHHVLPEAEIHSFEPLPDCFDALCERMGAVQGFRAYNLALGDCDSEVAFQRNSFTQSSSVLPNTRLQTEAFSWTAKTSTINVRMATLDSVMRDVELPQNLLIKVDVEGYEDRVLLGGEQTLRRATAAILETSFEPLHEGQALFEDIYKQMLAYGFRYAGNLDQLESPADGRVLQADALFLNTQLQRG